MEENIFCFQCCGKTVGRKEEQPLPMVRRRKHAKRVNTQNTKRQQ